jgi:aminoglycoside phosphotransferase (APT) family kinase protein
MNDLMIPEEKRPAVSRALAATFGTDGFEQIERLTHGRTGAIVFRIVVGGSPFLLRVIMRTDSTTARHFACMRLAAEAGLAPAVKYTNEDDRIAITEFVSAVPFSAEEAQVRMPTVLRTLHALPPFPTAPNHLNTTCTFLMHQGPALESLIRSFRGANILSEGECDDLFAGVARIAAVYAHSGDQVSSHNDLFKPDNVLFDNTRVWLVDWEAAFLNDRYADLAVVANLLVANQAEETLYLERYFGRPSSEVERARFHLMQQMAHAFYAIAFLLRGGSAIDRMSKSPEPAGFHRKFWSREFVLEDKPTMSLYGRVHLEQFRKNTRTTRYEDALRIVSSL